MAPNYPLLQKPRKNRAWDCVIEDDLRPAGDGKHCFYCAEALGEQHKSSCVIRAGVSWYHVALRNNKTNEIRFYRRDTCWDNIQEYMWKDGNYCCDCNRHLSFMESIGVEDWEGACCGFGGFEVLYIQLPDDTRIYLD